MRRVGVGVRIDCRRLPDGALKPLALPVWRWNTFYIEIIRSIFDGAWNIAPNGRAVNYWWGMKSGAEEVRYTADDLPGGTLQMLDLMEMDWLDECVENGLPRYDELDVKTRALLETNGLSNVKSPQPAQEPNADIKK